MEEYYLLTVYATLMRHDAEVRSRGAKLGCLRGWVGGVFETGDAIKANKMRTV